MKTRGKKKRKKEKKFSGEEGKEKVGSRIHRRLSANLLFWDYYKHIKNIYKKWSAKLNQRYHKWFFPHQNLVILLDFLFNRGSTSKNCRRRRLRWIYTIRSSAMTSSKPKNLVHVEENGWGWGCSSLTSDHHISSGAQSEAICQRHSTAPSTNNHDLGKSQVTHRSFYVSFSKY